MHGEPLLCILELVEPLIIVYKRVPNLALALRARACDGDALVYVSRALECMLCLGCRGGRTFMCCFFAHYMIRL
jgi:hypothetical protein